ncbi:uncharacterized protein LOC121624418 [Chelmon rostratus]|uniref:uncharacterized protein LOC121624418 n=1 Tax=Chelmon rostratus TaxID=109905 RepID=UPI001BECF617|nr:uncharacterized protein LOC121624418 [Chelmon rostratus]
MDHLFDFEGDEESELKDKLVVSLTRFIRLYSRQSDRLRAASESFTLTAARLQDELQESEVVRCLFTVFGGLLGAACGGVSGGALGALGAVGAATWSKLCGDINAVRAAVGLVGSVAGGVAGGVFGGAVGSAIGTAAEARGRPVHGVVGDVAWFSIGFTTGAAIGGIFGGKVGAAGGAGGGAFAALYTTRFAVTLVGGVVGYFRGTKDSKEEKMKSEKVNLMLKTGDFTEAVQQLVEELKTIKTISDKMASSGAVRGLPAQTARTLASATTLEDAIVDAQGAADLPQFVSCLEEAARRSERLSEDVKTTRTRVDKVLVSLRKR